MGYLDEFKELKTEIRKMIENISLSLENVARYKADAKAKAADIARYKEDAKAYIKSNSIADLSKTMDSPYAKGADTHYVSDEDDEYLEDSD